MMRVLIVALNGAPPTCLDDDRMPTIRRLASLGNSGSVAWEPTSTDREPPVETSISADRKAPLAQSLRLVQLSLACELGFDRCSPAELLERFLLLAIADPCPSPASGTAEATTDSPDNGLGFVHWAIARDALGKHPWEAFLLVDRTLERTGGPALAAHSAHEHLPGSSELPPYSELDEQLAEVLQALDEQTAVLVLLPPGRWERELAPSDPAGFYVLVDPRTRLAEQGLSVRLADLVHTIFTVCGRDPGSGWGGRSLVAGNAESDFELTARQEEIVRERLSGLGYLG
jgi:hypothetical protein